MMCALFVDVARGYYHDKERELDADLQKVLEFFSVAPAAPTRQSMTRVRSRYPGVRKVAPDLFDNVESALREASSQVPVRYGSSSSYGASEPSCVAAGTPVLMADGSELPIEHVQSGDVVLAYDRRTGRLGPRRVRRVFEHAPQRLIRLRAGDRVIQATPLHRAIDGRGLPRLSRLRVGHEVLVVDPNGCLFPAAIIETSRAEAAPVYNVEVEEFCSYVAGGVVVHSYVVLPRLREWLERARVLAARLLRRRRAWDRAVASGRRQLSKPDGVTWLSPRLVPPASARTPTSSDPRGTSASDSKLLAC